jgi:hypothetical protein
MFGLRGDGTSLWNIFAAFAKDSGIQKKNKNTTLLTPKSLLFFG